MLGMFLRSALPQEHLIDDAKDAMKLAIGLIATMCALILGLLVTSAKSSYDAQNTDLQQVAAKVVLLWTAFWLTTDLKRRKRGRWCAAASVCFWTGCGRTTRRCRLAPRFT